MRRTPPAPSLSGGLRALAARGLGTMALASALASALALTACQQEKKDLLALPAAYNPAGAELTLNKKNLEAFNLMSKEARRQHLKQLKETPGSFSGQAIRLA